MRSILTKNLKVCYLCGSTEDVDRHHCFHGEKGRKLATQYHLVVGLCYECHRGPHGVHNKKYGYDKDIILKSDAQLAWEAKKMKEKNLNPEQARQAWLDIFDIDYIEEYNRHINSRRMQCIDD